MYRLIYPETYLKKATKFIKKHPELCGQYQKTLELLELNPYSPVIKIPQPARSLERAFFGIHQHGLPDCVGTHYYCQRYYFGGCGES